MVTRISSPKPLRPLFAGSLLQDFSTETHYIIEYKTLLRIPSYLFAIAVGDFKFSPISTRTGVWAEESLLQKAVYEFKEADLYLSRMEGFLSIKYGWGEYNMLVLPQGFPYGGMENPGLTFLPQSLLVGDRSLVNVLAHEIAHSWFGNFVTNANWSNFWLNEGFTTWAERRILFHYDQEMFNLYSYVGYQNMVADIAVLGENSELTTLHPNVSNVHYLFTLDSPR